MIVNTINDDKAIAGSGEGAILAGRCKLVRQSGRGGMGAAKVKHENGIMCAMKGRGE